MADFLLSLLGWVARMESERRSEQVKAGMARRLKNGGRVGQKPGAKDRKKRNRAGYYERYHGKKATAPGSIVNRFDIL